MNDDLPPPEEDKRDGSLFLSLGQGVGALLWVVGIFAVVALGAYFLTAY